MESAACAWLIVSCSAWPRMVASSVEVQPPLATFLANFLQELSNILDLCVPMGRGKGLPRIAYLKAAI
jgi:hypothetical protein